MVTCIHWCLAVWARLSSSLHLWAALPYWLQLSSGFQCLLDHCILRIEKWTLFSGMLSNLPSQQTNFNMLNFYLTTWEMVLERYKLITMHCPFLDYCNVSEYQKKKKFLKVGQVLIRFTTENTNVPIWRYTTNVHLKKHSKCEKTNIRILII